jgi:MoaA/NifB/PqqE/SkfB family radical SAM enzyme
MSADSAGFADPAPPIFAQIEPVGDCNLRCPMCLLSLRIPAADGPAHLPYAAYSAYLEQLPAIDELHLQGLGEPLLHPRLCDMVEAAAARGLRVSVNTNLTRLSVEQAERLSRSLDTLHVSVDSCRPPLYERLRAPARFDRLLANLTRLQRARRRTGSCRLVFVAVLLRDTLDGLEELVRFAAGWGADALSVQHLFRLPGEEASMPFFRPLSSFIEQQALVGSDPGMLQASFSRALAAAAELGLALRLPSAERLAHARDPGSGGNGASGPSCDWPYRGVYITYRGEVLACCMAGLPEAGLMGDLARSSLQSIWEGATYRSFRRRLATDSSPPVCRDCAVRAHAF